MVTSVIDLSAQPLVIFLRENLQQLAPLFRQAGFLNGALVSTLRERIQSLLHHPPDATFQPFQLMSCHALPELGPERLAHFLTSHTLPPALFLSQPPAHFDSVLVPAGEDALGSGYVWCVEESLTADEVYYLLAHVYGHLALGHLRKGDQYSHYDKLAALRSPNGPARRWDRAVQSRMPFWFKPLPPDIEAGDFLSIEWQLPGFAQAFERFQKHQIDDSALAIQSAAAHYSEDLLEIDFSVRRDAQLFPHQIRGAAELAVRLQKLGVALLADSVGLGKTRTVATVLKLLRQYGFIQQSAVFTPSKLERNWREELALLRLKIGVPGDVDADVIIINKDKFKRLNIIEARQQVRGCDLLVIEEAHQDMRHSGNKFHRNMREAAVGKYGLLVTATPWNNRRGDIFSMLQPFAAVAPGNAVPAEAFRCFSTVKTGQKEFEQDDQLFRLVYNLTTLQRTRRQLRESGDNSVFYAPRRPYLVTVPYTDEQRAAFVNLLEYIEELRLPHFNPIRHLTPEGSSEHRLSGIHRFVLLKRAESSMDAFARSLDTLARKAGEMLEELAKMPSSDASIAAWLRQRYELEETAADEDLQRETNPEILSLHKGAYGRIRRLIAQAEQTGQLQVLRHTLLDDCRHDMQVVDRIRSEFQPILTRDPKLEAVLAQVRASLAEGLKVLCISQFADTAQAIYRALLNQPILAQKGVGLVVSSAKDPAGACQINGVSASRGEVLSRFAPQSWGSDQDGKQKEPRQRSTAPKELAILVGSDTLSVGQNLQDARVLINLDLCWNPMLHEQRIGRIDRPRHERDSAPLDIFYFLNLDIIEAELKLRKTIEQRLAATYQDTAFDDEILPGYFEMIQHFQRLRRTQAADTSYADEANELLEELAERSAKPPEVPIPNDELERAALGRLQEAARLQVANTAEPSSPPLLVTMGRVPLRDRQGILRSNLPRLAILAEIAYQPVDSQRHPVGRPVYRHASLALYTSDETQADRSTITIEHTSIVPFVDGLLAESVIGGLLLQPAQLRHLYDLLRHLEGHAQQEQSLQTQALMRARRYRSRTHVDHVAFVEEEPVALVTHEHAERVEARLASVRLLV